MSAIGVLLLTTTDAMWQTENEIYVSVMAKSAMAQLMDQVISLKCGRLT
jgi:hypothetical protein